MNIDDLILEFLNLRIEKIKAIRKQQFDDAANIRDKERKLSKVISETINPDIFSDDHTICEVQIEQYCLKIFNCSSYDTQLCVKSIERTKKLKSIGL